MTSLMPTYEMWCPRIRKCLEVYMYVFAQIKYPNSLSFPEGIYGSASITAAEQHMAHDSRESGNLTRFMCYICLQHTCLRTSA